MPKTELSTLVVDKTVLDSRGLEHRALFWVLTHNKYVKPGGAQYQFDQDYYGFFPVNRPEYVVKDLTVFSESEIDSMARDLDFHYSTDVYGIYTNEWIFGRDINERSRLIYGGTSKRGYQLQEQMFRNRKLIMNEFNSWASPTPLPLRFNLTRLYEADFSGWTGRYYHSLDTTQNREIPGWMRRLHRKYLKRPFDYPNIPGLVLVHESERIIVLQDGLDLDYEVPVLEMKDSIRRHYNLPRYTRYPYWFDINFAKDTNNIFADYHLHVNERGDSLLQKENLPSSFPAILGDHRENLRWYFCGDWSDGDVAYGLSYFAGINFLRKFFYNNQDELDRKKFFFEIYHPMVRQIIAEYLDRRDSLEPGRPLPSRYPRYTPYYRLNNLPLPDIDAMAAGRIYDPSQVLGTEYRERYYLDSLRQAQLEEAARTGNYLGNYEDTLYLTASEQALRDSLRAQGRSSDSLRYERLRDSLRQEKLRELKLRSLLQKREQQRIKARNLPPHYRVGGRVPLRALAEEDFGVEIDEEEVEAFLPKRPAKRTEEAVFKSNPAQQASPSSAAYRQPEDLSGQWHIVVASFLEEAPAREYLQKLEANQSQIIYVPSYGVYRISVAGFNNLAAAQQSLPAWRERFAEAWIVKF